MTRRRRRSGGPRTPGEVIPHRPTPQRLEKIRILIVCEGRETEPNYFSGLRDEELVKQRFSIEVQKGKGGSCLAVVRQAIAKKENASDWEEDFDEIWCVLDVEQPTRRTQVMEARTVAGQHGIQLALSNPSFECWLLAHFIGTKKSFADSSKVIAELNKHWHRVFGQNYEKNDEQLYSRLAARTQRAIDNARKVREQDWSDSEDIIECNSATDVYLLVERLMRAASRR